MSAEIIKNVLETGECPTCGKLIISDESMKSYVCEENTEHFDLRVTFHGGEKITATLNGKEVPEDTLKDIDW